MSAFFLHGEAEAQPKRGKRAEDDKIATSRAPDIGASDATTPLATIWSGAMMPDFHGEREISTNLLAAVS